MISPKNCYGAGGARRSGQFFKKRRIEKPAILSVFAREGLICCVKPLSKYPLLPVPISGTKLQILPEKLISR
jgi:hypothetical protein